MPSTTTYQVTVACNFHYQDKSEHTVAGLFESADDALQLARDIVERSLPAYQQGISADAMLDSYKLFGEDPFIVPEPDTGHFSAWDYAAQRCREICAQKDVGSAFGFTG